MRLMLWALPLQACFVWTATNPDRVDCNAHNQHFSAAQQLNGICACIGVWKFDSFGFYQNDNWLKGAGAGGGDPISSITILKTFA